MSSFTSEKTSYVESAGFSSAKKLFYLNAFWRVDLDMYVIKKTCSPWLVGVVHLFCFIVCLISTTYKFACLSGPQRGHLRTMDSLQTDSYQHAYVCQSLPRQVQVYQNEKVGKKDGENRGQFCLSPTVCQRVCRLCLCRSNKVCLVKAGGGGGLVHRKEWETAQWKWSSAYPLFVRSSYSLIPC